MSEDFHHKHIHTVVWIIGILLAVIIVAAVFIVQLTDNAPLGDITPIDTSQLPDDRQQDATVTTSQSSGQDGTEAGKAILKSDNTVQLGDEISVTLRLDTENYNINVVKVALNYDSTKLRYESFDKTGTVLPLEFRNEPDENRIIMSRGVPGDADPNDSDDGYTGSDGLFGNFLFTAIQTGSAEISLVHHGTIYYLDDGLGSKVYPDVEAINITIN